MIQGVRQATYTVDGDVVTADYTLDVGLLGLRLTAARVHETFDFDGAEIRTIVADITVR